MATTGATITNAGLNLLASIAGGSNVGFTNTTGFVAVGTGNTNPTVNDTRLNAEATTPGSRKTVTVQAGTNPGEFLVTGTLQANDAVAVSIQEVGFFAGSSATSAANTGTLVARALFSHPNKLNTEVINLVLDMTI